MYYLRLVTASSFAALIAACAGLGGAPLPRTAPNALEAPRLGARSITWGIGLSGLISETVPKGLGAKTDQKTFCQSGSKTGCPLFSLGKRNDRVRLHSRLAWSGGSFTSSVNPSSKLGEFSYDHTITSTSTSTHISQSAVAQTKFAWVDWLKATSATLPAGTKASFKVTTTLVPGTTKAPCNADDTESVSFNFSSNGLPGGYSSIVGGCVKGAFAYYIDKPSHPGKVIVETINGAVGQNLMIQGLGTVQGSLCAVVGCTAQSATLSGKVTYKIEALTHGVSFTTASGTSYK